MRLPNAHDASVEEAKVVEYLLNRKHPVGSSKAKFFRSFGFSSDDWREFAEALLFHGRDNEVANAKESKYGMRYDVDGPLVAPNGARPLIRTVWQHDIGTDKPRLITAYPLELEEE